MKIDKSIYINYEEEFRKRLDESKTPEERQLYTWLINNVVIGGL